MRNFKTHPNPNPNPIPLAQFYECSEKWNAIPNPNPTYSFSSILSM